MAIRCNICFAGIFFALTMSCTVSGQELVNLSTREGVTQSFLLVAPPSAKPVAAVVLLPGGNGLIRLRSRSEEHTSELQSH